MTFQVVDQTLGAQPIGVASTTQKHAIGHVVTAVDPTLGEGKFIYLKGVANTAVGSVVTYNPVTGATALSVAAARGPVAVATVANTSSSAYAFYQVGGTCSAVSGTVAANKPAYATATAGSIDDAVVTGDKIDGMTTLGTDSGGVVSVSLVTPAMNGNG